ncbi:hypothetical protein CHH78_02360 [Shouchella clausii]|uniref:hypothetical protein n=1 Tax=Shouchella clausii TaxID=79880 RepID=UPI00054D0764|nr:hypothetical protein [Shouchella clausii]MBU3505372.1 hypothetical protein [Shouchella clausii]MBU3534389.1 hypothetical protein [Shouchella clausii]MCZ1180138.1 hypothetical protein [Shouchella clausii]NMM70090.1 hypothetical protein [Shouchella clausii]PAD10177.1 hypothetical protein CHH76_05550 [Shouchella clausii]
MFQDQLEEWCRLNGHPVPTKKKTPKKRKRKRKASNSLSTRDVKELMGVNRAVYSRSRGGAYRQR